MQKLSHFIYVFRDTLICLIFAIVKYVTEIRTDMNITISKDGLSYYNQTVV